MKKVLFLSVFFLSLSFANEAMGQSYKSIPGPVISCPPGAHAGHSSVPMPKYIADKLRADVELRDTEDACSEIIVNYTGFSPEAEAAFEYAKTIWENALVSDIPIIIDASWTDLGENVLGSAGPSTLFFDFDGAPDDRMYPTALANQLAGEDLTGGGPHILANFNSEFTWYFGTDGNPPGDLFDFVSVVLHEIGHGLGFTTIRDYDEDTAEGTMGFGIPTIFSRYDDFLLDGPGGTPLMNFGDGVLLGDAFKSDNVYSGSPAAILANGGIAPRYYAPAEYSSSSIAHWDESDFPAGNIHSLMTPQIGPSEAIHNPGPITLGLFEDMGWELCQSLDDQPCTTWQDPSPTTGYTDFNTSFGGAPCDDGSGCPFNEIQTFEVYAGEAYAINNFIAGGTYTFSNCNGPGAGSWVPDFTVIAPSGTVDAFGSTTPCSITWTASESGTYLIVINEADNCGNAFNTDNGFPAITCAGDNVECIDTGCETSSILLDGPDVLCQDQTTTVFLPEPAVFPDGGGIRLQFINTTTMTGINLNVAGLPYTFDYDLNGLLSANGFDPFEGDYTINIFLYTDANDIAGTICASGENPLLVTFLPAGDPQCEESPNECSASALIVDGESEICEGETTTLTAAVPPEVPAGGGLLYNFVNVDTDEGLNWTGAPFPATFDSDLNGLLSANDFDPFSGTYTVEIFVYTDPADAAGSICASGNAPVTLTFLDADDPLCQEQPDPCSTAPLIALGAAFACEGETLTVSPNATFPPEVPDGGGIALEFTEVGSNQSYYTVTDVEFPFTFDDDLNGALSGDGFNPLSGDYEVEVLIYTNPVDVEGSICAEGLVPLEITFAGAEHPDCGGAAEPCTNWQDPTPTAGYEVFNDLFGGAPCDPGDGCPINEVTTFEVWGGEAYSVDNFVAGGTYTFSLCNGPGAFSWLPDFTIIAPSGEIDAFGSDTDCSITWTASESGTYLIVINEVGNCGDLLEVDNGFATLTCEGSEAVQCPESCAAGTLVVEGETSVCPGESTMIFNPAVTEIPAAGGYHVRVVAGADTYFFEITDPLALVEMDNTFDGQADTPFEGTATLRAQVYEDANNPEGSICDESFDIELNFLAADDEDCTVSTSDAGVVPAWGLFPNPAADRFSVGLTLTTPESLTLRITDISGRTVRSELLPAASGRREVAVQSGKFAPGVYAVTLEGAHFRDTKRLVIAR